MTGLLGRFGLGLAVGLASAPSSARWPTRALFMLLSLVTRRPVLLGLIYVLVWEGMLGNLLTGTRVLSIQQYVHRGIGPHRAVDLLASRQCRCRCRSPWPSSSATGATLLAVDRLRSFTVVGEDVLSGHPGPLGARPAAFPAVIFVTARLASVRVAGKLAVC